MMARDRKMTGDRREMIAEAGEMRGFLRKMTASAKK
jgi:hypothetical protein